jgi:uncharacterized protein (UPF0332 family)
VEKKRSFRFTMSHAKNKVEWCIKKAQKELAEGKKHRGLVKVPPSRDKAREYIEKADHNLKVTLYLQEGGYSDWCSSTLFYVIYHSFLAILAKYGYETRNQECTFALIESFIEDGLIHFTVEELKQVAELNVQEAQQNPNTAVNIREEYQYSTAVSLGKERLQQLLNLAKEILHKTKLIIEE